MNNITFYLLRQQKTSVCLLTNDMTLRLLNAPRLSPATASGIVGISEGLRCSGAGAAASASCGDGKRRREEERRSKTLAVTGARVEEWRRDRCMADRVDWKQRGKDGNLGIITQQNIQLSPLGGCLMIRVLPQHNFLIGKIRQHYQE